MSITVPVYVKKTFEVEYSGEEVFKILSDVPNSVSHFPNISRIDNIGKNAFQWEMKKSVVASLNIETVYSCNYSYNKDEGWVKWNSRQINGGGKMDVKWVIDPKKGATKIEFSSDGMLEIPLSSIFKLIVTPLVISEFENMVDKYIENLSIIIRECCKN